ncbi:hypothetical protein CCHR01_17527 [Colletotrichum chrysophilum]|uniref:Uncharacterized protein n=1 Tax=Colletotrichum chrysophilum TaxID=1836956 RepID=A0AAD9ECE2_9PEZI|nr:hypothetical protein CCHR01_17527 [Colletotrichum chrysophilum]
MVACLLSVDGIHRRVEGGMKKYPSRLAMYPVRAKTDCTLTPKPNLESSSSGGGKRAKQPTVKQGHEVNAAAEDEAEADAKARYEDDDEDEMIENLTRTTPP